MLSDNASTYLAAAEEIGKLCNSDELTEAFRATACSLEVYSKASTMVWGVLGETYTLNKEGC